MEIIAHRRNTIHELQATPREHGIEIDIRSSGNRLILHHDPFEEGTDFAEWLSHYQHGTLILNVKEEGLEARVLQLLKENAINKFFFLDMSLPFMVKWSEKGMLDMAVRCSALEPLSAALAMKDRARWVWVDYFYKKFLQADEYAALKAAGMKICLVSPELLQANIEEIIAYKDFLRQKNLTIDAVCTKRADLWL